VGEIEMIVGLLEQCVCEAQDAMEAFYQNPERRLSDPLFSELVDEFIAAHDALNSVRKTGRISS
jgi:hypothetical protein